MKLEPKLAKALSACVDPDVVRIVSDVYAVRMSRTVNAIARDGSPYYVIRLPERTAKHMIRPGLLSKLSEFVLVVTPLGREADYIAKGEPLL